MLRFEELISHLSKQKTLEKLILTARRKYVWNRKYGEEYSKLIEKARNDSFMIEIRNPCSSCLNCADGHTAVIFDYKSEGMRIKIDTDTNKEIKYTIVNTSSLEQGFRTVSVERSVDNGWEEVRYNIMCGCGDKCDGAWKVETGKSVTFDWDRRLSDCTKAGKGKYRIAIDFSTWTDGSRCKRYDSIAYSDPFELS